MLAYFVSRGARLGQVSGKWIFSEGATVLPLSLCPRLSWCLQASPRYSHPPARQVMGWGSFSQNSWDLWMVVLPLQRWDITAVEIKTEREASHAALIPWQPQGAKYIWLKCSIYPSSAGQMDHFRVTQGIEFNVYRHSRDFCCKQYIVTWWILLS